MDKLYNLLFSYEVLASSLTIFVLIFFLKKPFKDFWNRPVPNKILSDVLPEVLGICFIFLIDATGICSYNWLEIILCGLFSGYMAPKMYFVFSLAEQVIKNFRAKSSSTEATSNSTSVGEDSNVG